MAAKGERKQLHYPAGSRVRVLTAGGWKRSFTGTVVSEPEATTTLQGHTYIHWVKFDEPQEDINGADRYSKAQILGEFLEAAT